MKLENVTMEIRPRSDWEAVDAGLAMARRDFWRIWAAWWMAVWPVLLLIYPLREQPGWWAVIFFWWKLTGCRMVVFQLSRKLFGENPRWSALWRESMRAWTRRFGYRMLLARFSPWKLMAMVVEDLEGLRVSKYRTRMTMVTRRGEGMCMFLTVASACAVLWLGACLLVFGILFLPRGMEEQWTEVLEMQGFFVQAEYHWLVVAALVLAASWVDVFITAAGFGLYVNSRTWVEGWDVELAFKRMANRIRGVVGFFLLGLLIVLTPPVQALHESVDGSIVDKSSKDFEAYHEKYKESKEKIDEIKKHEDFKVYKEKYKVPKASSLPSSAPIGGLAEVFTALGYALLGILLFILLGAIVWLIMRARTLRGSSSVNVVREKARVVMGMEVTAASLPDDLMSVARGLWSAGENLQAMSLLYRGALAWWIDRASVDIVESDTEGDCMKRVEKSARGDVGYFQDLTDLWMKAAYNMNVPLDVEWDELCRKWPYAERRGA